ncbi:hypothetical protein BDZ89DRAFT_1094172 [Hymenopellis radicata]|nr:hypothetical protein BDZ89DRAFT_1094172 [Hymenopellis radicata]
MASLFWRQFSVLFWKNWIVLLKHPFLNILRCFLLPVAYGVFLSVAQLFLSRPNNYGIGTSIPIYDLQKTFDGKTTLIWADATNGTTSPSPKDIISRITQNFTSAQLSAVRQVDSPDNIPNECPQNFNLLSECFAAVVFHDLSEVRPVNYTLRADAGVAHMDVDHNSDFELRILPLQWAIDKAIIEMRTNEEVVTPIQWPFTQKTNKKQDLDYRLRYVRGIRKLLVLALFVGYLGIAYQLPGAVTSERANLVASHMKAMGLMDSAKVISWHLSQCLIYLPAWVAVAVVWHYRIFSATSVVMIIFIHVLLGLVLASWSFFVAAPFGKSPQIAAVASTFLAVIFAVLALTFSPIANNYTAVVFTVLFPPGFYIFAIRAICGFENNQMAADAMKGDPDNGIYLLPLIIAAIIDIILWPVLSVLWERRLYDARNPHPKRRWFSMRPVPVPQPLKPGIAISIKNLGKTFTPSIVRSKKHVVTAVDNLTLDIPKHGIFVLLGSNGAGKSTTLSILAGLTGRTRGTVQFENGMDRPEPGVLGIVPQKNVLFPELTCYQNLHIHYNAAALSGGQKRKLQLAIGLVGGSQIVLVDECTSGVDPLSRRALWRTLTSVRHERTVIFTTHFLDEADLLADKIAILAAPGKLVAEGSPVALKRDLGDGYTVQASIERKGNSSVLIEILDRIREITPGASIATAGSSQALYHLATKDPVMVQHVLHIFEEYVKDGSLHSYDVLGTTIEDIFLDLMNGLRQLAVRESSDAELAPLLKPSLSSLKSQSSTDTLVDEPTLPTLELSRGRQMSPWQQTVTIFVKRRLIARRSWLTPLFSILVAVGGATIPLVFISDRAPACVPHYKATSSFPLYMPVSPVALDAIFNETGQATAQVLNYPPGLIRSLGNTTSTLNIADVDDNKTFVQTITDTYQDLRYGGISMSADGSASMLAWEAESPGYTGSVLLNMVDNILYNDALNKSGQVAIPSPMIQANYEAFPAVDAGTLDALKWATFFGATMAVFPAFYALYVAQERSSAVQAMQFSNGLSDPFGLWLGHLSFDVIFSLIASSIIVTIFAIVASDQFHGLGLFWFVMVLYGIAATLLSYCFSLVVSSPLGAFAASAGYQAVMFLLYFAGYLFTLTYAKTSDADHIITILNFTLSLLSPVASVERAAFVSVNLFSLLCTGDATVSSLQTGTIMRYGGPIVYLLFHITVLLGVLTRVDRFLLRPFRHRNSKPRRSESSQDIQLLLGSRERADVLAEARHTTASDDLLRVLGVSKTYGTNKVVDDVTMSAGSDTIFALLGPNGAGKTTTFNMIRGDVVPDTGDVFIAGQSIKLCPQFTAIDSQLTVKEHLQIYGRLKGLGTGAVLHNNVRSLLGATGLLSYADRLASKLSGGNQRKLSLAIALMGNPSVILIDEFSTGVDVKMKRDMWITLKNVAPTNTNSPFSDSMEEASALANKVGILAKRMLAVGTIDSLAARYATYEVHFTCRTRQETIQAQVLMSQIPGSRMADDVATRFEVPIGPKFSLSQLFHILSSSGDIPQFTVEKASLESIFLKVIRQNDVVEEDAGA